MRGLARYGLILVAVFFLAGLGRAPAVAESPEEFAEWSAIERAPSDAALAAFLTKYPESPFRQKAAVLLAELRGTSPADVLDQFKGAKVPASASAAPATPEPPKLVGTSEQSAREDYDDGSGWFGWDDTLVFKADGTAELISKNRMNLYTAWHLGGCETGQRVGTYLWKRTYTVTVTETTVSLRPQAPAEVSRVEPACWEHGAGPGNAEPWVLDWVDGRLSNDDGEFVRRNY